MTLHIKFTSRSFDKIEAQCAVVSAFADLRPLQGIASLIDWRLNGLLSKVLIKNRFEGEPREALLLPAEGRVRARELLVVGLGRQSDFNESYVGMTIQFLLEKLATKKITDFVICFSDIIPDRFEWRNSIRLLVSKLRDFPDIQAVTLCEPEEYIKDARRRHMDFGMQVDVSFE